MRKRCTRVARPTSTSSRPVANGSSVPAWPTRGRPALGCPPVASRTARRAAATTSCEVGPGGLVDEEDTVHGTAPRRRGVRRRLRAGFSTRICPHHRRVQRADVGDRARAAGDEGERAAGQDLLASRPAGSRRCAAPKSSKTVWATSSWLTNLTAWPARDVDRVGPEAQAASCTTVAPPARRRRPEASVPPRRGRRATCEDCLAAAPGALSSGLSRPGPVGDHDRDPRRTRERGGQQSPHGAGP